MISAVEVIIEEFSLPEEIAAVTLIGLILLQLFIGTNDVFSSIWIFNTRNTSQHD
jgi:hypothetical protein